MNDKSLKTRLDSYLGAIKRVATTFGSTSAGMSINPGTGAPSATTGLYAWPDLEQMYNERGLASHIVDRPAEDSLARGFYIEGDEEQLIVQELDRLQAIPVLVNAIRWARLFGGGVVLLLADDTPSLLFPMDPDNTGEITGMRDYALPQISAGTRYDDNPTSNNFGMPLTYIISPHRGQSFEVHYSRLIIIPGEPLAVRGRNTTIPTVPWAGRSALGSCMTELKSYFAALQWALRILERKQQGIYSMKGMAEVLEDGDEGEALVKSRLSLIDVARSALSTVAIDAEDEYVILNLGLDGVQSVINEKQIALAASTNMPVTILFGRSPAGMNSTGTSDHQMYNTKVGQYQNRTLKPLLERFVQRLYGQRRLKAKQPDNWQIEFNALWLPTALEQAQTDAAEKTAFKADMEGLNVLVGNQGISAQEVRTYLMKEYPHLMIRNATPPKLPDHLMPKEPTTPPGAAA